MKRNLLTPHKEDMLLPLEETFHKFFDDFFSEGLAQVKNKSKNHSDYPKMNIEKREDELVLTAALPGMDSDDLNVEVSSDNVLTISGKMSSEYKSPEDSQYSLRELRQSAFRRSVKLPDNVNGDPEAVLKDGILQLRWNLKPDSSNGKKIEIKNA